MKLSRAVWAEINLDNLAHNMQEVRRITQKSSLISAVIKADGYGHGAVHIAQTLLDNGANRLAVATLSEAIELRSSFPTVEIMILGYTPNELAKDVIEHNIIQTIYSLEQAQEFSKIAQNLHKNIITHIKIDSGMHRLGLLPSEETIDTVLKINTLNNLTIEGIFTHFATADETNKEYTKEQVNKFSSFVDKLEQKGLYIPIKHVSNSAAIIDLPEFNFDMVRAGIMLYGLYPSKMVNHNNVKLKEVMCLKAKVSQVKELNENSGVSYGLTHVFPKKATIALLPIGYADGYSRLLSNKAEVLVNNQKASIVGSVCMDQCIIDVTDIKTEVEDEVILFGGNSTEGISIDNIANKLQTINYEIVCMVNKRVPRVYMKNNKQIHFKDYLLK